MIILTSFLLGVTLGGWLMLTWVARQDRRSARRILTNLRTAPVPPELSLDQRVGNPPRKPREPHVPRP